ncbi:MAG: hypothetical protein ACREAK_05655 [Nitrosarchaeum sp.]
MNKKKSIIIILAIVVLSVSLWYNFFLDETSQKTRSIQVDIMTYDQYIDEQIRESKTGNVYADSILSLCGNDEHCTVESLQKLSQNEKQEIVLITVDNLLDVFQKSELICHKHAHHIGEFLLGYFNANLTKALSSASGKCGGAIYHGIVENYFLAGIFSGSLKLGNLDVSNSCDILNNNPQSLDRIDCSHGFGHGLLKAYNYDISSTLLKCEEFRTNLERDACYKGVFMENQIQFFENKAGVFDEHDIFYPCNTFSDEKASACYHYQAYYILRQHQLSLEKGLSECDKILPEKFVKTCYYGMGAQARGMNILASSNQFVSSCQMGDPKYQSYCVAGGATLMAKQIGADEALQFCESVPENFNVECYKAVGRYLHLYFSTSQEIQEKCSVIENVEYYDMCLNVNVEERSEL